MLIVINQRPLPRKVYPTISELYRLVSMKKGSEEPIFSAMVSQTSLTWNTLYQSLTQMSEQLEELGIGDEIGADHV